MDKNDIESPKSQKIKFCSLPNPIKKKVNLNSSYFYNLSVSNKKLISQWLMRQYFSKEKNANKPWYRENVTELNVLSYISNPKSNFPMTPKEVVDFFFTMKKLQPLLVKKSYKKTIQKLQNQEDNNETTASKVHYGDSNLFDIGMALGGYSKTLINKIEKQAIGSIERLYGQKHPEFLDGDCLEEIDQKIDQARKMAAESFVQMMNETKDLNKFIETLHSKHILSKTITVDDREKFALQLLFDKLFQEEFSNKKEEKEELIQEMLLEDIADDDNLYKTYQYTVASIMFPKQYGRPKKNLYESENSI